MGGDDEVCANPSWTVMECQDGNLMRGECGGDQSSCDGCVADTDLTTLSGGMYSCDSASNTYTYDDGDGNVHNGVIPMTCFEECNDDDDDDDEDDDDGGSCGSSCGDDDPYPTNCDELQAYLDGCA